MAARVAGDAPGGLVSAAVSAGEHVAFGFRLHGVPLAALTPIDEPDWPALHVHCRVGPADAAPSAHLGDFSARLPLGGGDWLELDRDKRTATYLTSETVDADRLIHPRLAPAAAVMARWLGRDAFHAGAVLAGGGAWAVAGANEAGKSTLLASLAIGGMAVLTDDLLVVDRARIAYAGPRCIDLRRPVLLEDGPQRDRLRPVRDGSRERMDLPVAPAAAPLRGWLFLEWGTRVQAQACPPHARLGRLLKQRRWATEAIDPRVLLDLAALPAWTLARPRGREHMRAVAELLWELTRAATPGAPEPARGAPSHPAAA